MSLPLSLSVSVSLPLSLSHSVSLSLSFAVSLSVFLFMYIYIYIYILYIYIYVYIYIYLCIYIYIYIYIYIFSVLFAIQCSTIMRSILHFQDLLTFFSFTSVACLYSSVSDGFFTAVLLGRYWCTARLLIRVSDLKKGVFSCVDRLRTIVCVCSEKDACRQYGPSPLFTP